MQAIIGSEFPKIVIPLIDHAKNSIKIVVFDWRWYPNSPGNPVQLFNQAIIRAVNRGVSVLAIANSSDIVDTLQSVGVKAKKLTTKNLVHAKMMIIDGQIVVVGSHNYTQNAFTMNHEISMMHDDIEAANGFIDFFKTLWQL
jgi:phosphatidylserine/phosphatidylglycerophosphate/cardiolipin synthase-like enzyme